MFEDFDLSQANREALQCVADAVLASRPCNEPMHYMIAGNNVADSCLPNDCSELGLLKALANDLAAKVAPGMDVISVRLLFSPAGAPAQPFHLDFARHFSDVRTLFVAISSATVLNCTEVLNLGSHNAEFVSRARKAAATGSAACKLEDCMDRCIGVEPLLLDRWQVCMLQTSHAFHRRGANCSDFIRITFNVDVACVSESPDFVDVDMQRSLSQHRLCGRDVIDDLDEQDVSLGVMGIDDLIIPGYSDLALCENMQPGSATECVNASACSLAAATLCLNKSVVHEPQPERQILRCRMPIQLSA